jgi:hypothetical protein
MKHLGFGSQWLNWTSAILTSVSTSILLNWVLGKNLQCRRGIKQGDQIFPLLFVFAADLLQWIVNKAHTQGLMQLPIPSYGNAVFPIIQYVDDRIILLKASQKELICLKALLETYAQSTGLRVTFAKTGMIPINLSPKRALGSSVVGFKACLSPFWDFQWIQQSQEWSTLPLS